MSDMIRRAAVAGSFYPASANQLEKMVAGMVNDTAPKEEAIGLVCPHAGYIYSGPVAGAAISRVQLTDTVIIMGPNHTGLGRPFSLMAAGAWETPLGNVEIDADLAGKLLAKSSYLEDDADAHLREHSHRGAAPLPAALQERRQDSAHRAVTRRW